MELKDDECCLGDIKSQSNRDKFSKMIKKSNEGRCLMEILKNMHAEFLIMS